MSGLGASFLTDSHAHLDLDRGQGDLDGLIARARAAGVRRILTISSSLGDPSRVVAIARSLPETWAAIGVHPHEARGFDEARAAEIRLLAADAKVVAIGEIGLDYHYDHSPRDVQRDVFRRQIRIAHDVSLPIVVHSREAEDDTARILEEERAGALGGVIHCFTSRPVLAERTLAMGFCISFSGIVTFPKSQDLRDVAASVPLDRLLVETDAPFLAPVPHRGKTNEPAYVRETAKVIAAARGIPLEELAAATSANFERVFLRGPAP